MSDRVAIPPRAVAMRARQRGLTWLLAIIVASFGSWTAAYAQQARLAAGAANDVARYVPRERLFLYVEHDGLDAHRAAWNATALSKLLTQTKLGPMLSDLMRQALGMGIEANELSATIKPADVTAALQHVSDHGMVLALWGDVDTKPSFVIVVRDGNRPEVRRLIEKLQAQRPDGKKATTPAAVKKSGRSIQTAPSGEGFWFEKDDLVFSSSPDQVLAALDGKARTAVGHPIRAAMLAGAEGSQSYARGFVDFAALPPMPPQAKALGLDGIKHLEFQWGFQDDALRTVVRLVAPAPRRGLLTLVDQPAFGIDAIPPMPATLTGFSVLSVDLPKTYDKIVAAVKAARPEAANQIPAFEEAVRQNLGIDVRKDLLSRLGPKFTVYAQSSAGAAANPMMMMFSMFSGITITAEARDVRALSRSIDVLIGQLNEIFRRQQAAKGQGAAAAEFVKVRGQQPGYVLNLPPGAVPPGPLASMKLTLLLGSDRLAIAGTTAGARKALEPKKSVNAWKPTGAFAAAAKRLPAKMIFLNVSDPRDSVPATLTLLPLVLPQFNALMAQSQRKAGRQGPVASIELDADLIPTPDEITSRIYPSTMAVTVDAQGVTLLTREAVPGISSPGGSAVLVGLLLPAVQAAREAARRAQCTNNLKQIGLAMHNYHAATGGFPRPAIVGKNGKPLLSWRVAILPYINQKSLYDQFKQDEPWDSPHNKALLARIPLTYVCPSRPSQQPGMTNYRVFAGPGALFENGRTSSNVTVTDGTSNTLMVVEASQAVPWTRPDELPFNAAAAPGANLYGAGSTHPGGFNALFADGSVRFIKSTVGPMVLKALITQGAGEVLQPGSF